MKQSEKIKIVLQALYEHEHYNGEVKSILEDKAIPTSISEAWLIGERLRDEGLAKYTPTADSAYVSLTGKGIAHIEGDLQDAQSHTYVTHITNSPNSNVVNNSSKVKIIQNIDSIGHKVEEIKREVSNSQSITEEDKTQILDCLEEVFQAMQDKRSPKWAFGSLMSMSANFASVAQLVIQLGQLSGLY